MQNKLTFKEEWYFAKQDIVSYTMSTLFYILLNLITKFSFQIFIYSLFECLQFYLSFWFIRIQFDLTYHSDDWNTCKFWTRTMLCASVFALWVSPIKYTLLNSLFVAFLCCLILYLIALHTKKNIYSMSKDELYNYCVSKGLDDVECKIAYYVIIEKLKGKELYDTIGYSEAQAKRKRKKILSLIK